MILIVGLGNPGLQYAHTRHNVGFLCADVIAYHLGFPEFRSKFSSLISERSLDNEKIVIQKPQTFMNLSGNAVKEIVSFYKIPSDSVFVIHDDIDLRPSEVRVKFAGSSGGHNGLRNIDSAIGKDYWRIRIGIGRPMEKIAVADYVLSKFFNDELQNLQHLFFAISQNITNIIFAQEKEKPIQQLLSDIKQPQKLI